MLSCALLLQLPQDWQLKMHNEIASKLNLCIPDIELAKKIALETWRYISQDNFDKNELSVKLRPYLSDHASDFTEWVLDFAQKSLEYYAETVSAANAAQAPQAAQNPFQETSLNGDRPQNSDSTQDSSSRIFKNAMRAVSSQPEAKKPVDPLDDTLDNLIMKEKLAKMQGQRNVTLGVQSKSGKFAPEQFANPRRFGSKPPMFKNLTLINDSNGQSVQHAVPKVPKPCMNFPNCHFGDNCRFLHPTNRICKNWPNCFFGDKCAFIHPTE